MARGLFRKFSFWKIVGAYRSQWKRTLRRMFIPGYGKRGMGWWRNPKKAWYNFWYHRTSISLPRKLGYKPSHGTVLMAMAMASLLNLFAFPIDITKSAVRGHRVRKSRKARAARTAQKQKQRATTDHSSTTAKRTSTGTQRAPRSSSASASTPRKTSDAPRTTTQKKAPSRTEKPKATEQKQPPAPSASYTYKPLPPIKHPEPTIVEPDENTPKSKPKHEGDQYIRKRMIIAGSSYCDPSALDKLAVGTYLEVVPESDNPYDKNAVMLLFEGQKVGYIPKQETLPFVTALKLGRKIYAVITGVQTDPYPAKYEIETWFSNNRS